VMVIALKGNLKCPDDIFPNNWFSTHSDRDTVVFYPMAMPNRRPERRSDLMEALKQHYLLSLDMTKAEERGKFLEGTGSMVLDRVNKVVYAVRSKRTHDDLVKEWAKELGYKAIIFDALDPEENSIYHTNVMMWVGTSIAGICLESIPEVQRPRVIESLKTTGHEILDLTPDQIAAFAGNAMEVSSAMGDKTLVMSNKAFESLAVEQKSVLERHYGSRIIHPLFTEPQRAGGSVRCAMAAMHTNNIRGLLEKIDEYCHNSLTQDTLEAHYKWQKRVEPPLSQEKMQAKVVI